MDAEAAAEDYRSSLNDLVANSKPLINMLTMLADENQKFAKHIVDVIEAHICKVKASEKLPALYLIDSIIKNARESPYVSLFTKNIAHTFRHVFEQVDEKTRQAMFKLRQTWNDIFPQRKLYTIDVLAREVDPAWPITALPTQTLATPSPGIHVNPKFLSGARPPADEPAPLSATAVPVAAGPGLPAAAASLPPPANQQQQQRSLSDGMDEARRPSKPTKQDELLRLQQLEQELAQAKAQLERMGRQKQQPAAPPAAQSAFRKTEELQDPRISSRPRDAPPSLSRDQRSIPVASGLMHHPSQPMPLSDDGREPSSARVPSHALANHGAPVSTAAAVAISGPNISNQREQSLPAAMRHTGASAALAAAAGSHSIGRPAGWPASTSAVVLAGAGGTSAVKAEEDLQGAVRNRRPLADPRRELAMAGSVGVARQPTVDTAGGKPATMRPALLPEPPISQASLPSSGTAKVLHGTQILSKRISPIRDAAHVSRGTEINRDKDERILPVRDAKRERGSCSVGDAEKDSILESRPVKKASDARVAKASRGSVRSSDAGLSCEPSTGKTAELRATAAQPQQRRVRLEDQDDRAPVDRARIPLKDAGLSLSTIAGTTDASEATAKRGAQDRDERLSKADRHKGEVGRNRSTDVDMRTNASKAKDSTRLDVKKESHGRGDVKDKKQPKAPVDNAKVLNSTAVRSGTKGAGSRAGPDPVGLGASADSEDGATMAQMRPPLSAAASGDKDERVKPSLKTSHSKDGRGSEPKKSPIMAMKIPKKQPSDRTYRRHRSPDVGPQQPADPEVAHRSRSRSPRLRASVRQPTSTRGDFDMRQKVQSSSPSVSESQLPALNSQQREEAVLAPMSTPDTALSASAVKSSSAAPSHDDVDMRKVQPAVPLRKSRSPAEDTCEDVDLRVHSRKRQTLPADDGKDLPLMKKGRRSDDEDDFDESSNERGDLFGLHDQDYRRYSSGPPPASPAAHSGWTAFKESHMRNFVHQVGHRGHAMDSDVDLRQQQSQQFSAPYRGLAPRSPVQSSHAFFGDAHSRHADAMHQQQDQLRSLRSKAEWRYHNGEITHEDYQDVLARLDELQRLRPSHLSRGREWPSEQQHRDRLPSSGSPGPMHRPPLAGDLGAPVAAGLQQLQQHRLPPPLPQGTPFGQPPPALRPGPGVGRHSPVGRNHSWDWQQAPQPQESGGSGAFGQQPGSSHFTMPPPVVQHSGTGYGQAPVGGRFSPPPSSLHPASGRFTPPLGGRFTPPPLSGRFTPPPTHGGNFAKPPPQLPAPHQEFHGPQLGAVAGYSASQSSLDDDRMSSRYATSLSSPMPGQLTRPRFESLSEVVIDGKPYELTLGLKPRMINIGGRKWMIRADKDTREILIDEVCYYRLGDPPREFMLAGQPHTIFFHGHRRHIWVDGLQRDVRMDAPPQSLVIVGRPHTLRIESHTNKLIVDGIERGICTCGPIDIDLGGAFCRISFEPPPKQILIDGKVCELNFDGPLPVVVIDGRMHGIRFDGPPREILIDDIPYLVRMDQPTRIKLGRRAHNLAFGGPGHEVVIDGKHYEVIFNGPPREVNIGGSSHVVRLVGDPPGVKILGEVVQGDPRPSPVMPGGPLPPMPPPQPLRLPGSGVFGLPPQPIMLHGDLPPALMSMQPPPFLLAPPGAMLSLVPPPLPHPVLPTVLPPPATAMPASVPNAPVDVNELFSKLLQYGIISKKDPDAASGAVAPAPTVAADERLDDVPDLTDLSEEKLKVKHMGVLQRLYVGTQCATCGMRFLSSEANKYNQHLDWHFRQNKREKEAPKTTLCRKWYFPIDVWVTYEEFTDADESNIFLNNAPPGGAAGGSAAAAAAAETVSCPVATGNEKDDVCAICGDSFEHFWDEEEEAWHLKDAIRVKGKTYHPICYEDACETSIVDTTDAPLSAVVKDEYSESREEPSCVDAGERKESAVTAVPVLHTVPVSIAVPDVQVAGDNDGSCAVRPMRAQCSSEPACGAQDPPASELVEVTGSRGGGTSADVCPAPEAYSSLAPAAGAAEGASSAVISNACTPPHSSTQVAPPGELDNAVCSGLVHSPGNTRDEYDEPGTPVQDERIVEDS